MEVDSVEKPEEDVQMGVAIAAEMEVKEKEKCSKFLARAARNWLDNKSKDEKTKVHYPPGRVSFLVNNVPILLKMWTEELWKESGGGWYAFINMVLVEPLLSLHQALERLVKLAANADASKFAEEFTELLLKEWPTLPNDIQFESVPSPSAVAKLSVWATTPAHEYIQMSCGYNRISCYAAWPTLLHITKALSFIKREKLDSELTDMTTACIALVEEQNQFYATEGDRELPFYLWMNRNFCDRNFSCVVPQVGVGKFTASGIIFADAVDPEGEEGDSTWSAFKNGSLKIERKEEAGEGWMNSRVVSEPEFAAKSFLAQWKQPTKKISKPWCCIVESKRENQMMVLTQGAGYYMEYCKTVDFKSNIPMFIIGLHGTSISFGVAVCLDERHLKTSELQAFSFQNGLVNADALREMAACFVVFRWLMVHAADARRQIAADARRQIAADARRQISTDEFWHVHPFTNSTNVRERVDNDKHLKYPPKRKFTAFNGQNYVIKDFGEIHSDAMFTLMYSASAQKVPVDGTSQGSASNIPVVVRLCTRYAQEAHQKLSKRNLAVELFCVEKYHYDYDVLFVVMGWLDTTKYLSLDKLQKEKKLKKSATLEAIVRKLVDLRKALKEDKIVHGDLRPCNIFFCESTSDLKVLDFEYGTATPAPTPPESAPPGSVPLYPETLNVNIFEEWRCDDELSAAELRGSPITHEQDVRMIEYCIGFVKEEQ